MRLIIQSDDGDTLYSGTLSERGFTSGSLGYNASAKLSLDGHDYSVTFNAIQQHSKELPGAAKVAKEAQALAAAKAQARAARTGGAVTSSVPVVAAAQAAARKR